MVFRTGKSLVKLSRRLLESGSRREIRRNSGVPLLRVVIGDLHELEGISVRIVEVHPTPAGKHTLVDRVDRTVELDALAIRMNG